MSDEETTDTGSDKDWGDDLYKKWFRAKGRGGVLSLRPWFDAGKISVDIGELDGDGKLKGHTLVWANIVTLATYLDAVAQGTASAIYGGEEEFMAYGGGMVDGKRMARMMSIRRVNRDDGAKFWWKTGMFEAKEQSRNGEFIAKDTSNPVSQNMIQVTRVEMAEMAYRLNLAMAAWASQNPDWLKRLNTKKPKS